MKRFSVTETTASLNYTSTASTLPSRPTHCHPCQRNISVSSSTAAFLE